MVLLIDEMEAHLHPLWQRTILPAIMNTSQEIASEVQIQTIVVTHSPLILASAEPIFDQEQDKLFHLYLEKDSVNVDNTSFFKRGSIDHWLTSEVFGLEQPRSIEAEIAIKAANEVQ
jgi:predicted ATP-binding protein involved in virulence